MSLMSSRKTKVVDWRKEEKNLFFFSVLLIDIAKNKNRKKRIDVSLHPAYFIVLATSTARVNFFHSRTCIMPLAGIEPLFERVWSFWEKDLLSSDLLLCPGWNESTTNRIHPPWSGSWRRNRVNNVILLTNLNSHTKNVLRSALFVFQRWFEQIEAGLLKISCTYNERSDSSTAQSFELNTRRTTRRMGVTSKFETIRQPCWLIFLLLFIYGSQTARYVHVWHSPGIS